VLHLTQQQGFLAKLQCSELSDTLLTSADNTAYNLDLTQVN